MADEGVSIVEFTFLRSLSTFLVSIVWNLSVCTNPFKAFPWDHKWTLCIRSISGHASFALFNYIVPLAPLSLIIIIFNTSPFWISLIACMFIREQMLCIEVVMMVICFCAVIVIALEKVNNLV